MEFVEMIKEYAAEVWMIWGAIITIASIIVKITPTKKDDAVFNIFYKILNALALNPHHEKEQQKKAEEQAKAKEELEAELDAMEDDVSRDSLIDNLK